MSLRAGLSNWSLNIIKTCKIGKPALTMVANCFENIRISSTLTFFFPKRDEPPDFFFASPFFFLDLIMLVIITFFSFNK